MKEGRKDERDEGRKVEGRKLSFAWYLEGIEVEGERTEGTKEG